MTTNVYDPEERAALVAHYGEIEVLKAEQRELRLRNLDAAVWVRCPGEAHKTPFIDHCMVCMPWWGSWPACPICGKRLTDKFYCRTCRAHFGDRKPEYRTFELKAPETEDEHDERLHQEQHGHPRENCPKCIGEANEKGIYGEK